MSASTNHTPLSPRDPNISTPTQGRITRAQPLPSHSCCSTVLTTLVPFRLPGHSRRAEVCNASNVVRRANNVVEHHQPQLLLLLDLVGHAEKEYGGGNQEDQDNCKQHQNPPQVQFLLYFWSSHQWFLVLALLESAASRKNPGNHPWIFKF